MNQSPWSILWLILFLLACGPAEDHEVTVIAVEAEDTLPARANEDALTFDEARARKARIGDIHYNLSFDLSPNQDLFTARAVVNFELLSADAPLTIDLSGAQPRRIAVNRIEVDAEYNGFFITIPKDTMVVGNNELEVDYQHPYSKDGTGLHRFTDPEDGLTYLYTYLWPYYANRLFPAFDQPNLKATFDLKVKAPEGWTVVSTSPGEVSESSESVSTWTFSTTPKMSTYIFSLHAGPYKVWEEMAGDVPIRLFARQSLAEYVTVDEWFEVTRGGLDFYARYFDIVYPFGKYDQLIVPDFTIGAMENIAAVTFNEKFVQRQPSNRFERETRASVILHEMAHMWFGNLVTKDWWNGLWLNESFATLMANIALIESTEFKDTWHRFFTENKQLAYAKDSRVTTHPIEVPVNSTADFFSVFDAITYQKGSSVLKQLAHFVGYENHRVGVSNYLKEHAYGNTVLQDFIDAQSASSGRNLDQWSQQWLYQAGFNELETRFECAGDRIVILNILQAAPQEHPQLRQQRVGVALYYLDANHLKTGTIYDIEIDGEVTEVKQAVGAPCPAFVFPNHDDWGFARVVLDDAAINVIQGRIQHLQDPLARSMMIRSLYDMSRTGRIPIQNYIILALDELRSETNLRVLAQLTRSVASSVNLLYRLRPESEAVLAEVLSALEDQVWQFSTSETDSDRASLWFDLLLETSDSPIAQQRLLSLLNETVSLPALQWSADLRWRVVVALSRLGAPDAQRLISSESERDPSDLGQKSGIAADAALPDAGNKGRWLQELSNPESEYGLAKQRAAISTLFPSNQTALQSGLLQLILQSLPLLSDRDPYFMSSYISGLLMPICTKESVAAMASALDMGGLNSTTGLFLREAHQADNECLKLRLGMTLKTATIQ